MALVPNGVSGVPALLAGHGASLPAAARPDRVWDSSLEGVLGLGTLLSATNKLLGAGRRRAPWFGMLTSDSGRSPKLNSLRRCRLLP